MHKLATFLIVVVLIARGAIYIYDHNKAKIDSLVATETTITSEKSTNTSTSPSTDDATGTTNVSFTALTFLLTEGKEIYYYTGRFNGNMYALNRDYVGEFIKAYKNNMNPDDLKFIIKSDETATFKQVIDLLDEMSKNEVPAGHYKEENITKAESDRIRLKKITKNG